MFLVDSQPTLARSPNIQTARGHTGPPSNGTGTKILCFASLVPLLAIIIFIASRIARGEHSWCHRARKPRIAVAEREPSSYPSTSQVDIDIQDPSKHQSKRISRLQDMRKYLHSPLHKPSQVQAHELFATQAKPFANHRCSISHKLRQSSLLFFSSLTGRKQTRPAPTYDSAPPTMTVSHRELLWWHVADSIIGSHPHAKPLHTRSPEGPTLSSDYRITIPWYPNKPNVVITPAMRAANPSSKTALTTHKKAEGIAGANLPTTSRPQPAVTPKIDASKTTPRIPIVSDGTKAGITPESESKSASPATAPLCARESPTASCAPGRTEKTQIQAQDRRGLKLQALTNLDPVYRAPDSCLLKDKMKIAGSERTRRSTVKRQEVKRSSGRDKENVIVGPAF